MARNTEKREKWEIHTVDLNYGERTEKMWKMWNSHYTTWNMAWKLKNVKNETQTLFVRVYGEKHSKREKWKIHISGRVLWRENSKTTKMRCKHSMTWNMARDTQKRKKWDVHTAGPGLGQENWKTGKMRCKHCLTWNMARNTQKRGKWEMHTLGTWNMALNSEKRKKWEIHTIDQDYGKKTEKCGKWYTNTVGPGIWRKKKVTK